MTDSVVRGGRIAYLDSLRGLAILMVVAFHAYARWPAIMPYGADFAEVPIFKYGWLGVPLFFLISGFVILMTLETCSGVRQFLYRRWLRLFPGMLLVSVLVFASAPLFPERPAGQPGWVDLLPGLLFVEPDWLQFLLRTPVVPLEGAFWSLFVEFKFYVLGAMLFFALRRSFFVHALLMLFAAYLASRLLGKWVPEPYGKMPFYLFDALSLSYFGWFAAGAAYYRFVQSGRWGHVGWALAASLFSAAAISEKAVDAFVAALVVAALFAALVASPALQAWFDNRVLRFFGAISYPLYLMHENMMVSLVAKMGKAWPAVPGFVWPWLALALISALAYGVAEHLERPTKHMLDRWCRGLGRRSA